MNRLALLILLTLGMAACSPSPPPPQATPTAKPANTEASQATPTAKPANTEASQAAPAAAPANAEAPAAAPASGVVVSDAWARATPPSAPVGGGYLVLENTSDVPDRLLAIESPASASVEIHEMRMEGDVMKMRKLDGGLPLPPHQRVELKPGGYHLMFIAPHQPFVVGSPIAATLVFEHAGRVTTQLQVQPFGAADAASSPAQHMH